jgi:hypothetical protein
LEHVRRPRLLLPLAVAAALALAVAFAPVDGARVDAQAPAAASPPAVPSPPPPPAPPAESPSPSASGTPGDAFLKGPGQTEKTAKTARKSPKATANPEATATPTSPAYASLDGTWEVQVQYTNRTDYSYIALKQGDNGALTGQWKIDGKMYPLDGTYDGRLIHMVAKGPGGEVTLSGYVETASDMVGLVDYGSGKTQVAFTAEHRGARTLLK